MSTAHSGARCLQAALQQSLALLGSLLALMLSLAEEVRQLRVVLALRVLDVGLEAQGVVETRFGEPDDVVVLVLGAGDVAGLGCSFHRLDFLLVVVSLLGTHYPAAVGG